MIAGLSQASLEHTENDGIQAEGLVLLKYSPTDRGSDTLPPSSPSTVM